LFITVVTLILQRSGKSVRAISSLSYLCTKLGQLVLRKMIEIVATRCQILRLKCTEFAPNSISARPRWRAYNDSQTPIRRLLIRERRERKGKGREYPPERNRGHGPEHLPLHVTRERQQTTLNCLRESVTDQLKVFFVSAQYWKTVMIFASFNVDVVKL